MNDIAREVRAVLRAEHEAPTLSSGLHRVEKEGLLQVGYTAEDTKAVIDFEYNPREPRTYYTPEYPAYIDIVHIWVRGADIAKAFSTKALDELAAEIMEGGEE